MTLPNKNTIVASVHYKQAVTNSKRYIFVNVDAKASNHMMIACPNNDF